MGSDVDSEKELNTSVVDDEDDDPGSDASYGDYDYDYDEEEEYNQFVEDDNSDGDKETRLQKQQQRYTVLSQDEIRQRQDEDTSGISTVLSIPRVSASVLLRHYKWNVGEANDAWFADEEKVRKAVGLLEGPLVEIPDDEELVCGICFDRFTKKAMSAAACGHPFCRLCWAGYFGTAINDGLGCLTLRCPEPSCRAAIDQDMINLLASEEGKKKYSYYLLRSYVESNPKTKWCPATDCVYAVDFVIGSASYDVQCKCGYSFCFNCSEESHRPVDCGLVEKWVMKNSSESENMNWILANSKACPKCKRYIEKNMGCMHMTCTPPCKFEFCWLCLGSWDQHGEATGGFYACNVYKKAKEEGTFSEEERKREMAKSSLEKYTHYYERWDANNKSRQKALADLKRTQTVAMLKLVDAYGETEHQLQFLVDAWLQIIECRRVLKWTYAYGYYLPEEEEAKKQLFEYLQSEAEAGLERLHGCVEKELEEHLKNCQTESQKLKFGGFRSKLSGLTTVTRDYFENLVRALENGLSDVDSKCPVRSNSLAGGGKEGNAEGSGGEGNESMSSENDEDGASTYDE